MAVWVCFLRPLRPGFTDGMTDAEDEAWGQHIDRLAADVAAGVVILAGPALSEPPTGIVVFEAPDEAAALDYVRADPTVAGGHACFELFPFRVTFLRGRD